jgi:hypothetical protein
MLAIKRLRKETNFALVLSKGLGDVVLSCHKTMDQAEAAMRKHGGEPKSLFTNGLRIVNVSPDGNWELIEIFGKKTVRPVSK